MVRLFRRTAAALAVAGGIVIAGLGIGSIHVGGTDAAAAQDRRQNQPGKFDFYVLSLSWSPSFCEVTQERGRENKEQCGERPYSFVVHGLWPQYEKGFPEFCVVPAPRLDRNIVSSMLDLMPAPRLIFNEWDKHGTCSGLGARGYFDSVRKARAVVKIPEAYLEVTKPISTTPDQIEEEFVKANPGLARDAIAVTCDSRRLGEVRICMSKEFGFRSCPEVDRRGVCRRDQIVMPPVRGGRGAQAPAPMSTAQVSKAQVSKAQLP
jgi:ribonuclease T2